MNEQDVKRLMGMAEGAAQAAGKLGVAIAIGDAATKQHPKARDTVNKSVKELAEIYDQRMVALEQALRKLACQTIAA